MLISKTTFLEFRMCPKNIWLKLHRPEMLSEFAQEELSCQQLEQEEPQRQLPPWWQQGQRKRHGERKRK